MRSVPYARITVLLLSVAAGASVVLVQDYLAASLTNWHPLVAVEAVLIILLSIGPVLGQWLSGRLLTMRTGVAVLFAIIFGVAPLYFMFDETIMYGLLDSWTWSPYAVLGRTLAYAGLGIAGFHLGYRLQVANRLAGILPRFAGPWNRRRTLRVFSFTVVTFALSVVSIWVIAGGWASLANSMGRARAFISGHGYAVQGMTLMLVGILVMWAYGLSRKRLAWITVIPIVLYSAVSALLGSRSNIIVLWATLYLMYLLTGQGTNWARKFLLSLAMGVAALLVLVAVRDVRMLGPTLDQAGQVALASLPSSIADLVFAVVREFREAEIFAVLVAITPEVIPFLYGRSYVEVLFQPIPRVLWASKPVPAGFMVGQVLRGVNVGTPSTVMGELYLNFGVFGIVPGMLLFGLLCAMVDHWLKDNRDSPAVVLVFSFLFASLPQIVTRSFMGVVTQLLLFLLPTLVFLWYVTRRSRRLDVVERL